MKLYIKLGGGGEEELNSSRRKCCNYISLGMGGSPSISGRLKTTHVKILVSDVS